MQSKKFSRVDILDLKALMLKKIGPERFKRYFYCLDRFINQKLSKGDFDMLCLRTLGRENLPLHNQIIKSILKNACSSETPPQLHQVGHINPSIADRKDPDIIDDGPIQSGFAGQSENPNVAICSNAVVLQMSSRKVAHGVHERKLSNRPSPLGPNGKTDSASHQSTATENSFVKFQNNGDLVPSDYQRSMEKLQGVAEQHKYDEKLRLNKCLHGSGAILGKDQRSVAVVEDGEEVEQATDLNFFQSPLVAPLGIPFCSASVGGARKSFPMVSTCNFVSSFDSGMLSDSEILRQRMEQLAAAQGLAGGVTMECANLLNNMLDAYLKRLITSCVNLVGESSISDLMKNSIQRQQTHGKLMIGLQPSNHLHMQSGKRTMEEQRRPISVLDFKASMEVNPQQLGEDWPLLMENFSMWEFEE